VVLKLHMTLKRRSFIKSSLAAAMASPLGACKMSTEPERPPNIIFLLTDDQRFDALGCMGHAVIKTPNIDRLAKTGTLFKNAFVTTPICAASRASIFVGEYERTHKYTFRTAPLADSYTGVAYPSVLRANGYLTGFIGKFGIRTAKNFIETNFDYCKRIARTPYYHEVASGEKLHETDAAAYYAKEFISKAASQSKPFQLSVSFNAPHAAGTKKIEEPFPVPDSVGDIYKNVEIPKPLYDDSEIFDALPEFLKSSLNRIRFFWRWKNRSEYEENMRGYFGMITGIDNAVGEILHHLESNGLNDNTIVIFSSDNGFYLGDRGFAGKWTHFDQSIRVPLIINDPRNENQNRGIYSDHFSLNIDICPTILDYANVSEHKNYPGRSLKPISWGAPPSNWRSDFLCEHLMNSEHIPKWEGVRGEHYSYARYFEQKPVYEFLHDLSADPDQLTNLALKPEFENALDLMRNRCDALKTSIDKISRADTELI
jgi:arylsulfatase A-like enzyme